MLIVSIFQTIKFFVGKKKKKMKALNFFFFIEPHIASVWNFKFYLFTFWHKYFEVG